MNQQRNNKNKEIFKNSFILGFQGKFSEQELKEVLKNILIIQPSKEQWGGLIIYTKEISKEVIDGEIDKIESEELPDEWKGDIKNFIHAFINYTFTLLNEDFFYDIVAVVNKTGLSNEKELLKQILPIVIREMDKITARANLLKPSNYNRVENSVVKKSKQTIGIIKSIFIRQAMWKGKWNKELERTAINEAKKILKILQSLSLEEIRVLKEKLKLLAIEYVDFLLANDTRMSAEEKNLVKSFATSCLNYADAMLDEKILKDLINLTTRNFEKIEKNPDQLNGLGLWKSLQKLGIEGDLRNLLISSTNHLNNLSSETSKNNNASAEGERLIEDLGSNLNANNWPQPQNQSNANVLTNNVATNLFDKIANSEQNRDFNWIDRMQKVLTTTQSKGKWYENPWVIGFSVAGAFVIGGLIFWLFTKKKDKVKFNYN